MTIACAELCLRLTASCRSQSLVLEDALVSCMETAFAELLPPNDHGDDDGSHGGGAGGASSQGADAGQTNRTSIKMSDDDAALQVRFAAFAGQLARRRLLPEKLVHTDLLNRLLAALDEQEADILPDLIEAQRDDLRREIIAARESEARLTCLPPGRAGGLTQILARAGT